MTRWDEQEKQKSAGISGLLFLAIIVFAIGFTIGVLWGLSWASSVVEIVPPVFGEEAEILSSSLTKTVHITLYDGIGIKDSIVTTP